MSQVKYQGVIDLSVKNNSHTIAYEYIDNFSNGKLLSVLEVGCSSGYFGSALKEAGHTVWGIEPDHPSAAVAVNKLDYVFHGFFDDYIKKHPDKKFDAIVFGDVLEHIADPTIILLTCHNILTKGGVVVASVPNVAHIAVRAMLLEGHWDYAEVGILDKTHLRFFTKETIQTLFAESAYIVEAIKPVKLTALQTINACKMRINPDALATAEQFAMDENKEDFQYVVLARPTVRVLCIANEVSSSHMDVRLKVPLDAWAVAKHGSVRYISAYLCKESDIKLADVIVIQRIADINTTKIITLARQLNKKIVYEIDDLLFDLPDFLSHHKVGLAAFLPTLKSLLPEVDCITATTARLAKQMERFSRPTVIIPNCASDDGLNSIDSNYWKKGHATLIIASTDAVFVDFILNAINAVVSHNENIKVVVIGPPGDRFEQAGLKVERIVNLSYPAFKDYIRTIDNPIGVIPLDDSLFSSCKTAIKYFDYSLAGIPVICSNVPPYSDVIRNGVTGFLVDNQDEEWVNTINQLVEDVSLRKSIVSSAKAFVSTDYNLDKAVVHWNDLIDDLINNKFADNPPITPIKIKFWKKLVTFKFLAFHIFNIKSYLAIPRIIKRDGVKGLISRILPNL